MFREAESIRLFPEAVPPVGREAGKDMAKKLALFILGTIFISILCEIALLKRAFWRLESRSWDMRAELVASSYRPDPAIKLIVLDQESLDYFELQGMSWPLPHAVYAKLIGFLKGVEVKGVAFDVLLSDRSRYGAQDEAELAAAFSQGLPVVSGVTLASGKAAVKESHERFTEKQSLLTGGLFVKQLFESGRVPAYDSAILPGPEIVAASAGLGDMAIRPDPDGVSRRYLAVARLGDLPVLSLGFSLFNAASVVRNVTDLTDWIDQDGMLTMRFPSQGAYRAYSLASIYRSVTALAWGTRPEVDPKELSGSWILVGVTAPGLAGTRVTPTGAQGSDLEYHAAALDNLINRSFVKRLSPLQDNLFASAFVAVAMMIAVFVPGAILQIVMFALLSAGFVGAACLFAHNGMWVSMVAPSFAIAAAAVLGLAGALSIERARRKRAEGE